MSSAEQRSAGPSARTSEDPSRDPKYDVAEWVGYPGVVPELTVGRCADGALGDTPGEFKVEHKKMFVKFEETFQNLDKTLMETEFGTFKVERSSPESRTRSRRR